MPAVGLPLRRLVRIELETTLLASPPVLYLISVFVAPNGAQMAFFWAAMAVGAGFSFAANVGVIGYVTRALSSV